MEDVILSMDFVTDPCSQFVEFLVLLFFVDIFEFTLFIFVAGRGVYNLDGPTGGCCHIEEQGQGESCHCSHT